MRLVDKDQRHDDWLLRDAPDDEPEDEVPEDQPKETEMQVTKKFWAVAENDNLSKTPAWNFRLLNWNPKGLSDYVLIREEPYEITIDLPSEFDFRVAKADAIRGQIKKVRAEAQNEITKLTEMLNSILAIEG